MVKSPIKTHALRTRRAGDSWPATLARSVNRGISWIRSERKIRRDIGTLRALDNCLLSDIGMRRCEIEHLVRYGRPPERSAEA